jgi:hypothetical protein
MLTFPILGCGAQDDGPTLIPVVGTVLVDGTPLPGAGVSFRPDPSQGNTTGYIPTGTADADGRYELITAAKKGAPVGIYKVVVTAPTPPITGGEAPVAGPPPFDAKYANAEETDLFIEITDEIPAPAYDIELTM